MQPRTNPLVTTRKHRNHPKAWRYSGVTAGFAYVAAPRSRVIAGHVQRDRLGAWSAHVGSVCLGDGFATRHTAAHAIWEAVIVPQGLDGWKVAA